MNISGAELQRAMKEAKCSPEQIGRVLAALCPDWPVTRLPHEGAGLFVRHFPWLPSYGPLWLSWVSVCVLKGGRPVNRMDDRWEAARAAGLGLSAWDWFPDPDDPTKGLAEAMEFAAAQGCASFILNAEKGFIRRPDAALLYASTARAHAQRLGMRLGLVSYSIPSTVKRFPWAVFAEYCDFGVPEIYDRKGQGNPDYPRRAFDSWEAAGFDLILPACGIYVGRQRADGKWRWRWRTAREVREHRSLFPPHKAWIAWPISGEPPESALQALAV